MITNLNNMTSEPHLTEERMLASVKNHPQVIYSVEETGFVPTSALRTVLGLATLASMALFF